MRKIGCKWGGAEKEVDSGGGLYAGCSCKLRQKVRAGDQNGWWGKLVPRP